MDAERISAGYSREELEAMLRRMESAADIFYSIARSGHHQFVEFTGFIREYVKICRRAMEHGVDFGTAFALPIETYEAEYLGEKFGCIFGDSFCAEPTLVNCFLGSAFGVRATGFESVGGDVTLLDVIKQQHDIARELDEDVCDGCGGSHPADALCRDDAERAPDEPVPETEP